MLLERFVAGFARQPEMFIVLGRIKTDAEGGVLGAPRVFGLGRDRTCPSWQSHGRRLCPRRIWERPDVVQRTGPVVAVDPEVGTANERRSREEKKATNPSARTAPTRNRFVWRWRKRSPIQPPRNHSVAGLNWFRPTQVQAMRHPALSAECSANGGKEERENFVVPAGKYRAFAGGLRKMPRWSRSRFSPEWSAGNGDDRRPHDVGRAGVGDLKSVAGGAARDSFDDLPGRYLSVPQQTP